MATIEFVRERAQKARQAVENKEALMVKMADRIVKYTKLAVSKGYTEEQVAGFIEDWRTAPDDVIDIIDTIDNARDSVVSACKALKELRKKAEEWAAKLADAEQKEGSRNVPAILKFLDLWKEKVTAYYVDHADTYIKELAEYRAQREAIMGDRTMEYRGRRAKLAPITKAFEVRWAGFATYVDENGVNLEALKADLDNEAKAKYDELIAKVTRITGTITDAAGLTVSNKGDLNGLIIGDKGRASINTIGAAGYNIVRFHYRTLIREV